MRQSRKDKENKEKVIQNISPPSLSSISSANTIRKKQESGVQEKRIKLIEYRNGIYQGMVHPNDERTNLGLYAWDSGEVYFGEWKHDMLDGEGILIFPFGGFIHGFFMKNKINGAAFFKFQNGDIYEGFWRNGKLEGNCYKYFTDEERWILSDYKNGEFKRIISKGDGQPPSYVFNYITSTSDIATKHQTDTFYQDGLKIEAISFNDGGQYLGLVKNSMPTSVGIFKYSDGKYDVGFYKDGNLDGLGRLNLHNGDVYDGFLQKGLFHGLGLFFQKQSCSWIYGNFENNKCVNILKKGQGNFPIEIIEKFRMENHRKAQHYIDKITPFDVYFAPLYNQIPVGPEKHNFYLDLSISNPANVSNNGISKQQYPDQIPMKKVLPKDLTSSYQSPPKSRSKSKGNIGQNVLKTPSVSSSLANSASQKEKQGIKNERQSSKSLKKSQNQQQKQQQQHPHIYVTQSSQGAINQAQKYLEKQPNVKKEPIKKSNVVSPPPRQGRQGAIGSSQQQQQSNPSSTKKSTLKKAQSNLSNKQRSRQSSVSKIQNEKQEIDQQSIHDYDNMVQLMSQNPEGQINISQSQGQQINFDEVFNTESSPKSHIQGRDLKAQKSLAQMIGNDESDEPRQIPYQKSQSMAVFNSKKSSQTSSHKQSANLHEIGNVSKMSGIGQSDNSGVYRENIRGSAISQENNQGFIKPNIFGKKSSSVPKQQYPQEDQPEQKQEGDSKYDESDSDSSFSSYSSDKIVRKQTAPSTSGRKQIPIIKEEERLRSYSGTPANRYTDNQQKNSARDQFTAKTVQEAIKSFKNEQEIREDLEAEENKQFLEAERLSRQMDRQSPKKMEAVIPSVHDQEEEYGQIQIKDFINVDDQSHQNTNRGEQSRKGAESTPVNQFITIPNEQSQHKNIQIKQYEEFINREIIPESKVKGGVTPTNAANKQALQQQNQEHRASITQHQRYSSKKSNSILELENIRNEIANYEQMAQQQIPIRRKKSKQGRKDTSRETSSHPRTPQSGITPKNLPSQSPNFQQSPILTTLPNQKTEYQQEEELDLEESEHVLDSIKQIKQQMIHQLNDLENKQKQVTTPAASNFKYNIVPSFNIPQEENNILKDDSFNHDISPQNPIENFDSPFKKDSLVYERENSQGRGRSANHSRIDNSRSYRYYTEEEANQIAEKIEKNLVSQQGEQQQQRQKKSSSQHEELINEESMQVGDLNENMEINPEYINNREERVVRSKLENDPELIEAQHRQIQESLEQTIRINQMLNASNQQQQQQIRQQSPEELQNRVNQFRSASDQQLGVQNRSVSPLGQQVITNQVVNPLNEQNRQQTPEQQDRGNQNFNSASQQLAQQRLQQQQMQNRESEMQTNMVEQQNQQVQAQQSLKDHSAQTSPNTQSPINSRSEQIFSQSNITNPTVSVVTGQVVQVVKEILPMTQQTTILQKKLDDNTIQSTVVTKTVQPIVTTKIISPVRSRPSSQSNSPLNRQQLIQQNNSQENTPRKVVQQQQLLPQQVVGQLYTLVGGSGQDQQILQAQNRIFSEQTQNKIAQAVNEQWKQKNPEVFKSVTPMDFYQSIVQRQSRIKELAPEELEKLENDILILKQMKIGEDLQQIMEQNLSNVTSPLNKTNNTDIKNYTFQGDDITPSIQRRKQEEEIAAAAAKTALEVAAAAEKARKEYEIQHQYLQSHLELSQNHTLITQQQQKDIDELKKQQEEFIKQQLQIQKQQAEYLEKLQKQQSLIIQQGEDQRKRHEEEKARQIKEIEALEKQKNLRILEEEERLKQLLDMQEKVRKQIEDDLQRKKLEDEEHSRRQQTLFEKEQEILDRLQDEQGKLFKLQQDKAKLEAIESENKKVRELQLQMEEEQRQIEMKKLEELKREAAALREEQLNNKYKTEEERAKMQQLQLKYAEEQHKQQEILDQLSSQKLLQENLMNEQNITQQQDLLEQQKQIQEQSYALQQEQLRIQRECQELEILQKQRNEESIIHEQQRIAKIAAKEQELEQQIRLQNEAFLAQQEEFQRQKQQLESQKLDLILEQDRLRKQAQTEKQQLIQADLDLQEQLKKKQFEQDLSQQKELELQARIKQEALISHQDELQREKQQIESQKMDLILEQERLRKKALEEEERRAQAERIFQETLRRKEIEQEQAAIEQQNRFKQQQIQLELEQQQMKRNADEKLRQQQEQLEREKAEIERERLLQEFYKKKQLELEQSVLEQQNLLKQQQIQLELQQQELKKTAEHQLREQQEQIAKEKVEIEKQRIQYELQQKRQVELEQATREQEILLKQQQLKLEKEQQELKRNAEVQLLIQQEQIQKEKDEVEKQRQHVALMERERIEKEAVRAVQEQEEQRKKAEKEQRDNFLRQADIIAKEAEQRRGYVSPRQSSLDIPSQNQGLIQSILNNNNNSINNNNNNIYGNISSKTIGSANVSPTTNRNEINNIIRESQARFKESINQTVQQVARLSQISNNQTIPKIDQINDNLDQAEIVKRSAYNPLVQQPTTTTTTATLSDNTQVVLENYQQQKNVNLFNQIDQIVRSASQSASTSPLNATTKNTEGEVIKRYNRFEDSTTNQLQTQIKSIEPQLPEKTNPLDKTNTLYSEIKSLESNITKTPTVVQLNQGTISQDLKSTHYQPIVDEYRGSLNINDFDKSAPNNIRSETLKTNEAGYLPSSPINSNQNLSNADNNLQNNSKVSLIQDYIPYQKTSTTDNPINNAPKEIENTSTHAFIPNSIQTNAVQKSSNDTFNTIPPSTAVLSLQQPYSTNTSIPNKINNQPTSMTFNSLPPLNSYVPLSQALQKDPIQESAPLSSQINSIEEKMKEINQMMAPFSTSCQILKPNGPIVESGLNDPNPNQPTANFDVNSSISSIKRDPINKATTSITGQGIQPISSWTNPVSLNSSGGTAAFLGIPTISQKQNSFNQNNPQNSASQTLFASFGNEKNQGLNPQKSYTPSTDQQISTRMPAYTPSGLLNNSFSQQPITPVMNGGAGDKDRQSSVRSSGYIGLEGKHTLPDRQQINSSTAPINPILQSLPWKPSLNINTSYNGAPSSTGIIGNDPYLSMKTTIISPRTQELNSYRIATTPIVQNTIVPNNRQVIVSSSKLPESSADKFSKRLSITSDAIEEDLKRSKNQDSSQKFLNTLNSSTGFIGYKKKIKIQPSPQVIKETHLPILRNNSNNNSRDSSFFQQNNSFSQNNPKLSGTAGGNNNVFLNNSFNNSFSIAPKGNSNTNILLNNSFTDDLNKKNTNQSYQHQSNILPKSGAVSGGILKNISSQPKIQQFNSPVSQRNQSANPSQQNSIIHLNRLSPASDTSRGSVSLTKKTNVTVVHTPGTEGGVSLVRAIQNTYSYNQPANNDSSFHNSSFNEHNQTLIDSQASQFLQQAINSREISPVRKQIVIKKSDRINMNPSNTQQKYYERSQPILEDTLNEGSDQEQTPTNKSLSREKKQKKRVQIAGEGKKEDEVIDEQQENMCNIY